MHGSLLLTTLPRIIQDEILISNLPSVQLASPFRDIETTNKSFSKKIKCNIIDVDLKEPGEITISNCNVPSKEELLHASKI